MGKKQKMTIEKEHVCEIDENNIFAALERKDTDALLARSELLHEVGDLI